MSDFLVAFGLVLILEGLLFAAFPEAAKRAMANAIATPETTLRAVGIASALIGLAAIWLIRG